MAARLELGRVRFPPAHLTDPLIVRFVPMSWHDEYDYSEAIRRAWTWDGPIINVEHDMEYSEALARELLDCPHPRCTHAYRIHHVRDGFWAHKVGSFIGSDWVEPSTEWAAFSGLGFCKIAPEARGELPERCPWQLVEQRVNMALRKHADTIRGMWHIHWPGVGHYHYREGQDD